MSDRNKRLRKHRKYGYQSAVFSLVAACGLSACSTSTPTLKELPETETEYASSETETELQTESEEFDFVHLETTLKLLQLQYGENFTFAMKDIPEFLFEMTTEAPYEPNSETEMENSSEPSSEVSEEPASEQLTEATSEKIYDYNDTISPIVIPENFAYKVPVVPGTLKIGQELRSFPLPALPLNIHVLEYNLTKLIDTYSGQWSVYVKNLSTEDTFIIGDQPMKSASVMKLFIMGTVYDAINKKELERTSEVVEMLNDMIIYSSNEDSNQLLYLLGDGSYEKGIEKVNQYITEHHYSGETHEYNGFNNSNTILDKDHFNQVSAKDCGKLLERIYRRSFGSRKICNEVETMMLNQNTRYKIPAGLPEGVSVGNKTGEMDTVENDVAIIYGDKSDYILCVLSSDWDNKDAAISHIAEISSTVYDFFDDETYYLDAPDLAGYDYELINNPAVVPETETLIISEADTETETRIASEADTETEIQITSEADAETETLITSETDTETETLITSETDTETETLITSEADTETETLITSEADTETETLITSEADTETETLITSETDTETETLITSETDTETETIRTGGTRP